MRLPFLKAIIVGWVALALAGCNAVYSETPLFSPSDAAGSPPLRPGLWASDDPKCHFNETRAVQRWPKCASWILVRPGQVLELNAGVTPPTWKSTDYVLAAGEPRVLQTPSETQSGVAFMYFGLRPLRLDTERRIVAFEMWLVQCGPPPPDAGALLSPAKANPKDAAPARSVAKPANIEPTRATSAPEMASPAKRQVTLQPMPGLEIKGDDCVAHDRMSVISAAGPSKAWAPSPLTSQRWVRDTLP